VIPVLAHGVGDRADLPVPVWLFAYSAAFALLISFVALRILWPKPRLAAAAEGRPAPAGLDTASRVLGVAGQVLALALFVLTLAAAWLGADSTGRNLAPVAFYVVFWVGMQLVSAVVGDVWRRINPLRTIAAAFDRVAGRDPDADTSSGLFSTHWPATVGLLAFLWLELAYHDPGAPSVIGLFLGLYTALMLAGASRFGAGWLRVGDGFAVLFSLLAALAPIHHADEGRLRLRWPGAGLAGVEVRPGTLAVVLVLLGGTAFDGFTRTELWDDQTRSRRGWDLTLVNTVGLALLVATVAVLFLGACRLVATLAGEEDRSPQQAWRWVPSLVPIVLAYSVAHYFSLLVFEGQSFVALLSDPLGRGWDVLGTAADTIDYTVVSTNQIAYVQVAAIVVGHVGGVVAAHDRAVEMYAPRTAVRSQYPMLAVMVAYTVGGLLLLLNA
jgi:hypothetical protein